MANDSSFVVTSKEFENELETALEDYREREAEARQEADSLQEEMA